MLVLSKLRVTNLKTKLHKDICVDKYNMKDLIKINTFYTKLKNWDIEKFYINRVNKPLKLF